MVISHSLSSSSQFISGFLASRRRSEVHTFVLSDLTCKGVVCSTCITLTLVSIQSFLSVLQRSIYLCEFSQTRNIRCVVHHNLGKHNLTVSLIAVSITCSPLQFVVTISLWREAYENLLRVRDDDACCAIDILLILNDLRMANLVRLINNLKLHVLSVVLPHHGVELDVVLLASLHGKIITLSSSIQDITFTEIQCTCKVTALVISHHTWTRTIGARSYAFFTIEVDDKSFRNTTTGCAFKVRIRNKFLSHIVWIYNNRTKAQIQDNRFIQRHILFVHSFRNGQLNQTIQVTLFCTSQCNGLSSALCGRYCQRLIAKLSNNSLCINSLIESNLEFLQVYRQIE